MVEDIENKGKNQKNEKGFLQKLRKNRIWGGGKIRRAKGNETKYREQKNQVEKPR